MATGPRDLPMVTFLVQGLYIQATMSDFVQDAFPPPPKCWDDRCVTLCMTYAVVGIEPRASCMLEELSANWDSFPAYTWLLCWGWGSNSDPHVCIANSTAVKATNYETWLTKTDQNSTAGKHKVKSPVQVREKWLGFEKQGPMKLLNLRFNH